MNKRDTAVVAGLGEIGRPLLEILSRAHTTHGIDVAIPYKGAGNVDVLHICYPFEITDFVGETARYIAMLKPAVTVIHSTIAVGTTRAVAARAASPVVHSPVRGKHIRMAQELQSYAKFVGSDDPAAGSRVAAHLEAAGMTTKMLSSSRASELAKLTETTYFGVLIAWAQEVERYCDVSGVGYEEVASFYKEIKFFPPVSYFPGVIGGHCVMPNIKILSRLGESDLLRAIELSNDRKRERDASIAENNASFVLQSK